jgi:hypothetical protein
VLITATNPVFVFDARRPGEVSLNLQVQCQKMNKTKFLKGHCHACGGRIEFPADAIGMQADCPHCGTATELMLAPPPEQPSVPRKTVVWTGVTILVLLMALAAVIVALKRAEKRAASERQAAAKIATADQTDAPSATASAGAADFQVSEIKLLKTTGTSVAYATGTVTNGLSRQRFGVRIYVDLFDGSGNKIGQATDYQQVIEPNGQWTFKALAVDSKATSARLSSVTEQP